ncbi:Uncharacterised protein [Yersinia enterocolitica]|nr:Uncharacterised protein [Yersinia enterocolitica]
MFGFFRKKRQETEPGQGSSITAKQFIALMLSDEKLSIFRGSVTKMIARILG